MTEPITLPSGSKLVISVAPFDDAKALYQAVLEELKHLRWTEGDIVPSMYKDMFCAGFTSARVEAALNKCFSRCTYDGAKIVPKETFEPVEKRQDFMVVCAQVAKANIDPFTKALFAEFRLLFGRLAAEFLQSQSPKTT